MAEYLAIKKSNGAKDYLREDAVLLTADSVVILNGTIYGKPEDAEDAKRILRQLSGNMHTVITGVCLSKARKTIFLLRRLGRVFQ